MGVELLGIRSPEFQAIPRARGRRPQPLILVTALDTLNSKNSRRKGNGKEMERKGMKWNSMLSVFLSVVD